MNLELKDKTAIVTGGSRGIGKAIAAALAREGCDIAIIARDMSAAAAAANEIEAATGRNTRAYRADTGSDDDARAAVTQIVAEFSGVDILVNAAAQPGGQATPPALSEITSELFWTDVNVKVMGYLRMARECAPHMRARGWGRIINISGLAARQTGSTIGSIRNVGVAALTKNLADELGPYGINVVCVHPGLTRTEKTPAMIARQARAKGISEDEIARGMAASNSVRRLITAEDVAEIVAFLASPRAVAINGESIGAGGGGIGAIHY
ncbi:MAG: short-chain dehydrogenase [Rhizobiales bacterium 65-9]|nr:SDR family oxidoreductase [Hyphomicrobiales bacterium]OJY35064.1 MAG: short-chain dehydrogenase [Rhizobiales bacterium 65-9]